MICNELALCCCVFFGCVLLLGLAPPAIPQWLYRHVERWHVDPVFNTFQVPSGTIVIIIIIIAITTHMTPNVINHAFPPPPPLRVCVLCRHGQGIHNVEAALRGAEAYRMQVRASFMHLVHVVAWIGLGSHVHMLTRKRMCGSGGAAASPWCTVHSCSSLRRQAI